MTERATEIDRAVLDLLADPAVVREVATILDAHRRKLEARSQADPHVRNDALTRRMYLADRERQSAMQRLADLVDRKALAAVRAERQKTNAPVSA